MRDNGRQDLGKAETPSNTGAHVGTQWETRRKARGSKATAWFATPGKTHLFSAVVTTRGIYSLFSLASRFLLKFARQAARWHNPFFHFDSVFSMYFEGPLEYIFQTFSVANLPS